MNDRFKFRVWDKENKKFLHDLSFDISYSGSLILSCGIEGKKYINPNDNNRYILIQCTGLKDKNGKLIYEGDLVKDITLNRIFEVGYKKCAFYLENEEHIGYFHELATAYSEKRLEVIGNIYENKELLNERRK